jgi:signal transduction histidine kinase
MFAAVVLVEWRGWLPGFYPEGAVAFEGPANPRHLLAILLVQGMWIVVTLSLLMGLVRRMRLGEASLRKANQEVRRFSEMQSNFSRVTIHDLKAPAAAAQSFLNNLRDGLVGELTDKQRNLVEGALRRLEGQMVLLRDFEIMAALDSVSMEKQSRELDLAVLLKGVVLDNQDMAGIHRHDLRLESSEDPPPVRGIEPLLRESVANFVTNAIKYTPEGGKIRVRVRNLGERVRVEVEDNGIGVSEEDRKKLFQEFVRLRRKDAPPREGSGLGLSIVSRIMDMHGGKAGCDSVLNQGSIFWLELPVAKKPN